MQSFYRFLFLLGTFLSGFVSLVYQLAWQRYLAILIGSEAKSSAIVVSVFLVGLAIGYYLFGRLMARDWERQFSTKIYGYVELLIGIYAVAFPLLFPMFQSISFGGPDFFIFDVIVVGLCVLLPTILMGASIPVLTTVLPESASEVNSTHAKIYGWNTLGACLGVLTGGFFLLPNYGIPMTMLIAGGLNIALSFIFLANQLKGPAYQPEPVKPPKNELSEGLIYFLVFIVGLVTISFETVLIRLVGISIGSSVVVFPTVLSVFIFALGLGSLLLPKVHSSKALYKRLVTAMVLWSLVFLTVPYWGVWAAHVRVSLTIIPSNYWVFNGMLLLLFGLIFFVPVFLMGQILPIGYSLLDKTGHDYGKKCGFLYSFNTIGTAFGGIVLGYLLLYFINLDAVFRLNIILLGVAGVLLSFKENKKGYTAACAVLGVAILFGAWNRENHSIGVFRVTEANEYFFKTPFQLKLWEHGEREAFITDGPNTTVAIFSNDSSVGELEKKFLEESGLTRPVTVAVNGKSDGNTFGDFSTMYLTSALPYFLVPAKNITAALVGFGTGMSAGTMGKAEDVREVDVIEISSALLKHRDKTAGSNFDAHIMEKANYIHSDAFRHFTKTDKSYELIVTEPSNPWVMGVENLFTDDFIRLAKSRLTSEGVLAMWIQNYAFSEHLIKTVLRNAALEFSNIALYQINSSDSIMVMSESKNLGPYMAERFEEKFQRQMLNILKIKEPSDFNIVKILNTELIRAIAANPAVTPHSLVAPTLAENANRARFLKKRVEFGDIVDETLRLHLLGSSERFSAFKKLSSHKELYESCQGVAGVQYFCKVVEQLIEINDLYQRLPNGTLKKLQNYQVLRRGGFIKTDFEFLKRQFETFTGKSTAISGEEAKHLYALSEFSIKEGMEFDSVLKLLRPIEVRMNSQQFRLLVKEIQKVHQQFVIEKNFVDQVKKSS